VKPAPFEYHAPASAQEAVELMAELGDGAKVIAGGQSLVPVLAMRLAVFDHLIDIRRITALRGIQERNDSVWIGAGTTESEIGGSEVIARRVPLLSRATPLIGHFQIRNRGTIGGSLAHADAAAEYPAVALALDATIEALSPRGQRTIPVAEFFTGIWTTALEPDELLTGVSFPAVTPREGAPGKVAGFDRARIGGYGPGGTGVVPPGNGVSPRERSTGFAIEEFARRSGDFAVAGAAVAVGLDAGGRVSGSGIGLFGLGSTALRAASAEASALEIPASDIDPAEIGRAAVAGLDSVPSDLHGTADYRKKVGAAMVARAWEQAVKEAASG
jgi:aerobic carbon-monoxide dehydrogenase medium subunit